jgi:hypothetical protein
MARRPPELYLVDHHAGSVAGLELAKRAARNNRGTAAGEALEQLVGEIRADQRTLELVLALVGTQPSRLKDGVGWTAEKLGRLKLNGRLRGPSPLGRLYELEALSLGVAGKRALWRALQEVPGLANSPDLDLPELERRADEQLGRLEELRREAAAAALRD